MHTLHTIHSRETQMCMFPVSHTTQTDNFRCLSLSLSTSADAGVSQSLESCIRQVVFECASVAEWQEWCVCDAGGSKKVAYEQKCRTYQ